MSISKYLPSKQFALFFGIAIVIGVVIFIVFQIFGSRTEINQEVRAIATREIIEDMDSDNDGLTDWEEPLWGLNPDNPDTDGDGILDKQEVEQRRGEIRDDVDVIADNSNPETETEKFARQLLTVALNIQQASGGQVDPQQIQEVAGGFTEAFEPNLVDLYSISDLNVSNTTNPQTYYQQMNTLIGDVDFQKGRELIILERAIATNRKNNLKDLEEITALYASVPEQIKDVPLPPSAAQAHLDYMNSLTQMAVALFSLSQYFDDPIIAVRGLQEYTLAEENVLQATENLTNYLVNNGIVN